MVTSSKNLNFKYYPNHELGMAGRFVLLAFTVTVMGPWAKRFLPVRSVKQALWLGPPETGEAEQAEMVVEMMPAERHAEASHSAEDAGCDSATTQVLPGKNRFE